VAAGLILPVIFDGEAWNADRAGASLAAREQAARWRGRIEVAGGLPRAHLRKCEKEHDFLPLPNCVKVRIPDPYADEIRLSPWGAVLEGSLHRGELTLFYVAFGQRHPEASGSNKPSVYEIAHQRLTG
jgi:hypothetical protein